MSRRTWQSWSPASAGPVAANLAIVGSGFSRTCRGEPRSRGVRLQPDLSRRCGSRWRHACGAKCLVSRDEDGPAETLGIRGILTEKLPDRCCRLGAPMSEHDRFHPAGRKEDVAGPLNLTQEIERRTNEPAR